MEIILASTVYNNGDGISGFGSDTATSFIKSVSK